MGTLSSRASGPLQGPCTARIPLGLSPPASDQRGTKEATGALQGSPLVEADLSGLQPFPTKPGCQAHRCPPEGPRAAGEGKPVRRGLCPAWSPQVSGDILTRARAAPSCPREDCAPALGPVPHTRARPKPDSKWPWVHPPMPGHLQGVRPAASPASGDGVPPSLASNKKQVSNTSGQTMGASCPMTPGEGEPHHTPTKVRMKVGASSGLPPM